MKLLPLTVLVLATSPVALAGANPPSPPPPDVPDKPDPVEPILDEPLRVVPAEEASEPKVRDGKGKGGKGKGGKGKGGKGKGGDSESDGKGKGGSKSTDETSGKGKGASKGKGGKGGKGKGGKGKGGDNDGSKGKGSSKGKGESEGKGSMDGKGGKLDNRGIVSDPDSPIAKLDGPPEVGTLCTISVDGSSAQVVPSPPATTVTETTTNFQIEFASDLSHAMFELDVWFGTSITQATLNCGRAGENGPIVIQVFGNDGGVGVDTHGTLSIGILTNEEIPTTITCGDIAINNIASFYEAILQRKIYLTIESSETGSQVRAQVMKGGCSS